MRAVEFVVSEMMQRTINPTPPVVSRLARMFKNDKAEGGAQFARRELRNTLDKMKEEEENASR